MRWVFFYPDQRPAVPVAITPQAANDRVSDLMTRLDAVEVQRDTERRARVSAEAQIAALQTALAAAREDAAAQVGPYSLHAAF